MKLRWFWIFNRVFVILIKERDRESLLNDLEEIYQEIMTEQGRHKADVWFFKQMIKSISPMLKNRLRWMIVMTITYLKSAFRHYLRHKRVTAINICGLAVGLAAYFIIQMYVSYETSFDTFHDNSENIYRLRQNVYRNAEMLNASALTVPALAEALADNYSEIEAFSRITREFLEYASFTDLQQVTFLAKRVFIASPTFLTMFNFPLLRGNPKTALNGPLKAVLCRSTAEQQFGDADPIGRTILYNGKHPFEVTGICEDVPPNSHIKFDMLISYASIPFIAPRIRRSFDDPSTDWSSDCYYTYVLLHPGTDPVNFESKLNHWLKETRGDEWNKDNTSQEIVLQPLEEIHLYSDLIDEIEPDEQGNYQAVHVLRIIAGFILVLAWINYTNIVTARAMDRAREVGIRRIAGAHRQQLVKQFLFEYAGQQIIAAILAGILVLTVMPYFRWLTETELSIGFLIHSEFIFSVVLLLVTGSLLAGLYPAFMLSAFRPVKMLRSYSSAPSRGIGIRKLLVTLQLSVSVALIAGTFIILQQLFFLLNKDEHIHVDQMLILHAPGTNEPPPPIYARNISRFRENILQYTGVISVSTTTSVPGEEILMGRMLRRLEAHKNQTHAVSLVGIDSNFIPAFGIQILSGRNFSPSFSSDADALILNETSTRLLGYETPSSALGQKVIWRNFESEIVGVIEDYNQLSPKVNPIPMAYFFSPNQGYVAVKVKPENLSDTIGALRSSWQQHFKSIPFDYFFQDAYFYRHFINDRRFGRVFTLFSILTIFIACLGMFSLASYNASRRTKEIGIRKASGANIQDIYHMLTKQFIKCALIAGLIGIPIAYVQLQKWLEDFTYRIEIQWWNFAVSWIIVVFVLMATISAQTLKAAMADPVEALRCE